MFRIQRRLFIIATAHRVSVGMDAGRPCVAVARAGRPRELSMRQEAEFRLKRDVVGPALLQGGGVALMFGGLAGQGQ